MTRQANIWQLTTLRDKVFQVFQNHKPHLEPVLRYWMFEYIAPEPVEMATKRMVLHQDKRNTGTTHTFSHKNNQGNPVDVSLTIKDIQWDTFTIAQTRNDTPQADQTFRLYKQWGLRHVVYNGKTHRELPDSGNVYHHIHSQYQDILQHTGIDLAHGAISPEDKIMLEIIHLFHDIPEMGYLEIANNHTQDQGKTDYESEDEWVRAIQIIQSQDILSEDEKKLLQELYEIGEPNTSLFKFFERLRRITSDNMLVYSNSHYMGNREKLFAEMAVWYTHMLTEEFDLPSGNKVVPIELPSIQQHLKNHKLWLDFSIAFALERAAHKMHPEKKAVMDRNIQIREDIKKKLAL